MKPFARLAVLFLALLALLQLARVVLGWPGAGGRHGRAPLGQRRGRRRRGRDRGDAVARIAALTPGM